MSKTRRNRKEHRVVSPEALSWFRARYRCEITKGGFNIIDRGTETRITSRKKWHGVLLYARDSFAQRGRKHT